MAFNVFGFLIGRTLAEREGIVDQESQNRVALVGGVVGPSATGLVVTSVLARREAESLRPVIAVNPTLLNYGEVNVGTPVSQTFGVSNIGTADLEVEKTDRDATEDFVVSGGGPFTVAPGATRDVEVSFTPSNPGEQKGDLLIFSNDPGQPIANIKLEGTGKAVAPAIDVTPASHDFPSQDVGETSPPRIFVVRNTGNAELAVTATTLRDPGQFVVSGGAPFTVPPGVTHDVEVKFRPTSDGRKDASLDIDSTDPARPTVTVTVSGTATDPQTLASRQLKKP